MNEATIHRCPREICREPLLTATLKPSGDVISICPKCGAIPIMIPGKEYVELLTRHLPTEERRTLIVSLQ